MDPVPWRDAWHDALYATGRGFYRAPAGPAAHFTTAANGPTGAVLACALLRLWLTTHDAPPSTVVDVGAGRGELATHLLTALNGIPTRVLAVDVVERPPGLHPAVEWMKSPGGPVLPEALDGLDHALVVAHEWLDVVPCAIAQVDDDGVLRTVLVDPASGTETLGAPAPADDLAWCESHWPTTQPGDRVEVGSARDLAWQGLVGRVRSGLVVAVDYAHTRAARPTAGTLAAYASGQQVGPVPDGSCDITAHVAIDSLRADELCTQRDRLRRLGVSGRPPEHALATADPIAYLRALETCSAEAALIDPGGYGGFWWAVTAVLGGDVA